MTVLIVAGMFLALVALSPISNRALARGDGAAALGAALLFTAVLFGLAFLPHLR